MKTYLKKIELLRAENSYSGTLCIIESSLEELKGLAKDFLHLSEYEYFKTLQYEKRQHSYLLGRYCAKMALMQCLSCKDPSAIEIAPGVFQQPVVRHQGTENIQVSIAHGDSWATAIAFPEEHPMGIDIEVIATGNAQVIDEQLTAQERLLIRSSGLKAPLGEVLFWTIKEALAKTIRCGLMIPLEIIELKKFEEEKDFYLSHFTNFDQYKVQSYLIEGNALSIALPKNTKMQLTDLNI